MQQYANTCSITGRVSKASQIGYTKQNVPACDATVIINESNPVIVHAFGSPALVLGTARVGQLVAVMGSLVGGSADRQFEVKAQVVAIIPEEHSHFGGAR